LHKAYTKEIYVQQFGIAKTLPLVTQDNPKTYIFTYIPTKIETKANYI